MRSAFTLIELLVVITIIVLLLALLTPALDRAIYQAELAVCGAQIRGMTMTLTTYATGSQRRYPYHQTFDLHKTQPSRIAVKLASFGSDDRAVLGRFLSVDKHLNDPFVEPVELQGSHADTNIFCSYSLWFGAQYPSEKGMFKLGDAFTWRGQSYSVLVTDIDAIRGTGNLAYSSHPALDGSTQNKPQQDLQVSSFKQTASFWAANAPRRGPADLNFGIDDGSVARFQELAYDAGQPGTPREGPIGGVPEAMDGTNPDAWWHNLPAS